MGTLFYITSSFPSTSFFFFSLCLLHFCLLSLLEKIRCFVKSLIITVTYSSWNTTEKCDFWTPKPVYWSPKRPGYVTAVFSVDIFTDFIFLVLLKLVPNTYSTILENIRPHLSTFRSFTIYAAISINWWPKVIWHIWVKVSKNGPQTFSNKNILNLFCLSNNWFQLTVKWSNMWSNMLENLITVKDRLQILLLVLNGFEGINLYFPWNH